MTDLDFAGQGRADQTRRERRRRGDETLAPAGKLVIPPEVQARLDREGLVPRWVNDVGSRIHDLTVRDDYDTVEGVEPVPVVIDRKTGETAKAHLLAKPRDFIEEDQGRKESRRRAQEDAMLNSPDVPAGGNPNSASAPMYVAKGSRISRGNQILE